MFTLKRKQEVFEIGGIKVGGQTGELPTVLIGSLFHKGHKIVKEPRKGVFDKRKAEHLIKLQEEMSDKTENPCMLDLVGETVEAFKNYLDFVSGITDVPFLINGPHMSVRVPAAEYVKEIGLLERSIYNSLNYTVSEEEIGAIRKVGLKAAIVQSFNPKNPRPEGMLQVLKTNGEEEGLLRKASRAGIEKPLVFMPVLDVPGIGLGASGVYLAKEEFGLPTGTAPIGVVGLWRKVQELGRYAKRECRAGAAALAQAMGANFIIYGSTAKAKNIFPVCAMVDAIIAYNARTSGIKPLTKNHPLYRIF